LKSQGVAPKKSELGINFTFEGWNFLFWDDIDDPLFFRLILPGVFDVTDENFAKAIMACNNINWNFKVVKAVLYDYEDKHDSGASVWLCFEQVLESTPQVDDLVPRAVQSLLAAADAFNKEMNDE
jgi:hypothetical protein